MAEHREWAPERRPVPPQIPMAVAATLAAAAAAFGQSPHPFSPPTTIAAFSFDSTAGFADLDRDGSPDLIVPGVFWGTMINSLDEAGNGLKLNQTGPVPAVAPQSPSLPFPIAIAGGDLDGDKREDVVMATNVGTLHFMKNHGATQLGGFQINETVVDSLAAAYPINPPFVTFSLPILLIDDFDDDGDQDVLLCGGPIDRWSGQTNPGFVGFYEGDGTGNFVPHVLQQTGCPIDAEFADLDGDGVRDRLVVLVETGSLAYAYDVMHFAFSGGTIVQTGPPQTVIGGRYTALEVADVIGDANPDYVMSCTSSGAFTQSEVYCFAGNGAGFVDLALWSTLPLPAPMAAGDFICSFQIADWNRDGHKDLAVLRGYVEAPATATGTPTYQDSELLIAMGPGLAFASMTTVTLSGHHSFGMVHSPNFALLPLDAEPDHLRLVDLSRDADADFVVPAMRPNAGSFAIYATVVRNETPQHAGDARFEKVGSPTGGLPSRPARIGFEGGRPEPGNADFAATILNVQGGSLVGLVWGTFAYPNLIQLPDWGFDVHVVPEGIGGAAIAGGSGASNGFHSCPLPIPNNPAVVGDVGYFQFNYFDPASGTFGGTQATGVWIGN